MSMTFLKNRKKKTHKIPHRLLRQHEEMDRTPDCDWSKRGSSLVLLYLSVPDWPQDLGRDTYLSSQSHCKVKGYIVAVSQL